MGKVIVRVTGGIGNQLFCYAAARRLALVNDAELVIDDVTGFIRDRQYCRRYALNHFNIPCRKATPAERLEPFERYRRGLMKWKSRLKRFEQRHYIEQDGNDFDERILTKKVEGTIYLEGYWQSDRYFKDVEQTIRQDLQIVTPMNAMNQEIAERINHTNSVAVHVRWFDAPESGVRAHNVPGDYYRRAIELIESRVRLPHYFVFSNYPRFALEILTLPRDRVTVVTHNHGDENAYADLWLMRQCQHFVIANSTFSWWGAWLSDRHGNITIAPSHKTDAGISAWGFNGLIPEDWLVV